MQMPGRNGSLDSYRYGFQNQEKDDEIKGEGNSLNYKFRMHDPRVGRFFAQDPLFREYPWNSPYAFSENMVMHAIELEGLEAYVLNSSTDEYTYNETATEDNVPEGYNYVGTSITDVSTHFEKNSPFKAFLDENPAWEGGKFNGPTEMTAPSQHSSFGGDWSYLSREDATIGQSFIYESANAINIFAQFMTGHHRSEMINLNGTPTGLEEGVLAMSGGLMYVVSMEMRVAKTVGNKITRTKENPYILVKYNKVDPYSSAGIKGKDIEDGAHYFSNIVDNYMSYGSKFTIQGNDNVYRSLFQVKGSLHGNDGIFEWIVETGGNVTHRVFIKNGKISGVPNQFPKSK